MAAKHPDDLTIFVFEQGDLEQRELLRMLEPAGTHAGEPPQLWPRQWRDERGRQRHLRPLEACGLFTHDPDDAFLKRLTARSLLESRSLDAQQLARMCEALGPIGARFDTAGWRSARR
jgi:hypothetical protein